MCNTENAGWAHSALTVETVRPYLLKLLTLTYFPATVDYNLEL